MADFRVRERQGPGPADEHFGHETRDEEQDGNAPWDTIYYLQTSTPHL